MKAAVVIIRLVLTLCGLAMAFAGCANVQPWERGTLSDYTMRPDRDPLDTSLQDHVNITREQAAGGRGVGKGGCGCN